MGRNKLAGEIAVGMFYYITTYNNLIGDSISNSDLQSISKQDDVLVWAYFHNL